MNGIGGTPDDAPEIPQAWQLADVRVLDTPVSHL